MPRGDAAAMIGYMVGMVPYHSWTAKHHIAHNSPMCEKCEPNTERRPQRCLSARPMPLLPRQVWRSNEFLWRLDLVITSFNFTHKSNSLLLAINCNITMSDLGSQLNQLTPEQRQAVLARAQQEANQTVMQGKSTWYTIGCSDLLRLSSSLPLLLFKKWWNAWYPLVMINVLEYR